MAIPGYNPQEEYHSGFEAIPDGYYTSIISSFKYKETKSGGQMLVLEHQIVEGAAKGRLLWDNLNVVNSNETAQNISMGQLKKYFAAAGSPDSGEESDLLNKPITIKTVTKTRNGYENTDISVILGDVPARSEDVDDDIPF